MNREPYSIILAEDLANWVDHQAVTQGVTGSAVIRACIRARQDSDDAVLAAVIAKFPSWEDMHTPEQTAWWWGQFRRMFNWLNNYRRQEPAP